MKRLILLLILCVSLSLQAQIPVPVFRSGQDNPFGLTDTEYNQAAIATFICTDSGYITPNWTFSGGTVQFYVNGVLDTSLTTATEASIAITRTDTVDVVVSDPGLVTIIDLDGDALRGDVSQFSQFQNLTELTLPDMDPKGHVSDTELLTNPAYPADLTGWTQAPGAQWAATSSAFVGTGNSADNYIGQDITGAADGNVYTIAYHVSQNSLAVKSDIELAATSAFPTQDLSGDVGWHEYTLFATNVAGSTKDFYINIDSSCTGGTITIDYFSVKAITNSLTNGGFDSGAGANPWTPTAWSVTAVGDATSNIVENPAGECQIISDGTFTKMAQFAVTTGLIYRGTIDVTTAASGSVKTDTGGSADIVLTATGTSLYYFTAVSSGFNVTRNVACDFTIDNILVLPWPDQNIGQVSSLVSPRTTSLVIDAASNVAWVDGAFDQGISLETLTIDAVNWTTAEVNAAMASLRVATDGGMTTATITFTNVPEPTGQGDTDVTYIGNAGNTISVP